MKTERHETKEEKKVCIVIVKGRKSLKLCVLCVHLRHQQVAVDLI